MNMRSWVAKGIVILSDRNDIQNKPEKMAKEIFIFIIKIIKS